jgi:hypothetical protein
MLTSQNSDPPASQPRQPATTYSNIQIQTSLPIEGARRNQTGIFAGNYKITDALHATLKTTLQHITQVH